MNDSNQIDDILSGDMSQVDTSFPLLPESIQEFKINSVTKEPNKKGTGNNLVVKMETTQENTDKRTGDKIQSGLPATVWIGLVPSDNYPIASIKKAVATLCQSAGVQSIDMKNVEFPDFIGKIAPVKVSVGKDQNDEPRNDFRFVVPSKK